jgi:hypothetical protein
VSDGRGAFLLFRAGPETVERALVAALRERLDGLPPLTGVFRIGMGSALVSKSRATLFSAEEGRVCRIIATTAFGFRRQTPRE